MKMSDFIDHVLSMRRPFTLLNEQIVFVHDVVEWTGVGRLLGLETSCL